MLTEPRAALGRQPTERRKAAPKGPAGNWPLARLIGFLVLLTMLPLVLLTGFTIRLASNAVADEVKARARSSATLSAVAIQKEVEGLSAVVESYAKRPDLLAAIREPHPDMVVITEELERLEERPGIATAFLADPAGRVIAVVPQTPAIVGKDLSYLDWYQGTVVSRRTYVSAAYQSPVSGQPRVVAVASPIRSADSGAIVAILGSDFDLSSIQGFVDRSEASQGLRLTVTDQRAVLLAAPGYTFSELKSRAANPLVAAALRGHSGVTVQQDPGGRLLSAYVPIAGLGWTVTASVPEEQAFASVGRVRLTVLAVAVVLGLALLGGIAVLGLTLRDRRQAERALRDREEMLRAVFTASPDIITLVGADGVIAPSSPAIRDLLGYDAEEQARGDRFEIVHPDDREGVQNAVHFAAGSGKIIEKRYRIRHADGRWVVLESRMKGITDSAGASRGVVVSSRDVTYKAALEQALRDAKEEAELANRAKSEFLSRMSHELRTPLNAILGFGQLLEMEDLDAGKRESVEHILKGGRHLLDLINEVLDIARIETGRISLSLEPVAIDDALTEALDLIRPLAATRGLDLQVENADASEVFCLADRQRLKQILLNLLSNAVKYNREGGRVTVRVARVPGGRLRVEVSDQGAGIAPEKLDRLFTPFDRLGAEQTKVEGIGLGLALSQRLAGAMGGTITAETRVGEGSTFVLDVPAALKPEERDERMNESDPADKVDTKDPRTLLCIEDNPANLKLMQRVVSRRPTWRLLSAMQGSLGLELARQHHPDLILLDLHLPDLSGEEVLRSLLADPRTRQIPVVVLSADATPTQVRKILGAGADAYLTKPLDVRRLLELMDETLTAGRLNNAG
jgi:PAS domain S-box-containing protein